MPNRGVKISMVVIRTQGSFFRGLVNLATKRLHPALELPMMCLPTVELLAVFAVEIFGE